MIERHKSRTLNFYRFIIFIMSSLIMSVPCLGWTETRGDLISLSKDKLNKAAQQDLISILASVDKINIYTFRRLGGIEIPTKPYGTDMRGLCRMDEIVLKYAPAADGLKSQDLQIKPYGVEARTLFHVTQTPLTELHNYQIQNAVWRDGCNQLSSSKTNSWFIADGEIRAIEAVNFIIKLKSDLEKGNLTPNCIGYLARQTGCLTPSEISAYDIGSVKQCSDQYGILCLAIETNSGLILTVTATLNIQSLTPDRILSVSVDQEAVVTSN